MNRCTNQQNRDDHVCSGCGRQMDHGESYWRDDSANIVCDDCKPHPQGCSCGAPDCPQHIADQSEPAFTDADWCPACKHGPVMAWDHCEKCGRDVCAACYAHGDCDR